MHNRVFFEPEYSFESMAILIDAQNQTHLQDAVMEPAMDAMSAPAAEVASLRQLYKACADFEASIHAQSPCTGEEAEFLFRDRAPCNPYAQALWYYQAREGSLPVHKRAAIAELTAPSLDDGDPPLTEEDFFRWLDGPDVSPEARYDLLKLYHRFDAYDQFFREQVCAVTPLIRQHLPLVQGIIDEKMGYVQEQLARHGVSFFRSFVNIDLDDTHDYVIYPSLVRPNSMRLYGQDDLPCVMVLLGVGVLDAARLVEGSRYHSERVLNVTKALADPTKWGILMTLRAESLYSAQLAERMNLSGATISHHMGTLASLGIVLVRKQGNRVYYEINRPVVEHYFSELSARLLPDVAQRD